MNIRNCALTASVLWLFFSLTIPSTAFARDLVLVSAASNNHKPLSVFEIRKIFLGYSVKKNNKQIFAIRNKSDDKAYQIFLQKFIHLSAKNYERRLLSKTFRTGSPKVSLAQSVAELKSALIDNKSNISIMWFDEIKPGDGLQVIQTLWKEVN
ncbi:hypothetical protein JYU12_02605 [bacterium AH-315-K03]|nr:hypothetical protein [bacterium AH-315-K03]